MKVPDPHNQAVLRRGSKRLTPWCAGVVGLFCLTLAPAVAQYEITWHSITPASTGSGYSLVGRIEQPDWLHKSGGGFELSGGLAGFPFVATVVPPELSITASGLNSVVIAWNPTNPGWVLQESTSLLPTDWTNSPSGGINPAVVPVTTQKKFYRLIWVSP